MVLLIFEEYKKEIKVVELQAGGLGATKKTVLPG